MNITAASEIHVDRKMSRQLKWKIKQFRAGKCTNCPAPRTKEAGARKESTYKRLCWKCGEDRKKKRRAKAQQRKTFQIPG